jgi:hypothetical protein
LIASGLGSFAKDAETDAKETDATIMSADTPARMRHLPI